MDSVASRMASVELPDSTSRRVLMDRSQPQSLACILCGDTRRVPVFRRSFDWLVRCCGCRLQFASPQPDEEELAAIYGADYFGTFGYSASNGGIYSRMKLLRADRLLAIAERYVPPGRLLDVGSALGECLLAATRRGWQVNGIERNAYAVDRADEVVPGATTCCSIDDYQGLTGQFDLITCHDVLEHVGRPDRTLRRVHSLLRPGGVLLVTTIDSDSLPALLLGPKWFHIHRDHLWYFDRRSLAAFCAGAGFETARMERACKVFNMNYILEILGHCPDSPIIRRVARAGLCCLPKRLKAARFSLPEGLLLIARRPG